MRTRSTSAGTSRPVQPQPQVLGVKDRSSRSGPVRAPQERGRGQAPEGPDLGSYFQEIGDSSTSSTTRACLILQSLPPTSDFAKLSGKDLIEINAQYRTINHYVIELHVYGGRFENLLRFKENPTSSATSPSKRRT